MGSGPLLLPALDCDRGRRCLVLDLDETLVHSSFKPIPNPDFILPVEIEGTVHRVYVLKRPGCDEFLEAVGRMYEVVIFTASLSKYADPLLDLLDPHNVIRARLFREACVYYEGSYVKDMAMLGRDMASIIIIDNSPASYLFQPENALPCGSFFDCMEDTELWVLLEFLRLITRVADVRQALAQWKEGSFYPELHGLLLRKDNEHELDEIVSYDTDGSLEDLGLDRQHLQAVRMSRSRSNSHASWSSSASQRQLLAAMGGISGSASAAASGDEGEGEGDGRQGRSGRSSRSSRSGTETGLLPLGAAAASLQVDIVSSSTSSASNSKYAGEAGPAVDKAASGAARQALPIHSPPIGIRMQASGGGALGVASSQQYDSPDGDGAGEGAGSGGLVGGSSGLPAHSAGIIRLTQHRRGSSSGTTGSSTISTAAASAILVPLTGSVSTSSARSLSSSGGSASVASSLKGPPLGYADSTREQGAEAAGAVNAASLLTTPNRKGDGGMTAVAVASADASSSGDASPLLPYAENGSSSSEKRISSNSSAAGGSPSAGIPSHPGAVPASGSSSVAAESPLARMVGPSADSGAADAVVAAAAQLLQQQLQGLPSGSVSMTPGAAGQDSVSAAERAASPDVNAAVLPAHAGSSSHSSRFSVPFLPAPAAGTASNSNASTFSPASPSFVSLTLSPGGGAAQRESPTAADSAAAKKLQLDANSPGAVAGRQGQAAPAGGPLPSLSSPGGLLAMSPGSAGGGGSGASGLSTASPVPATFASWQALLEEDAKSAGEEGEGEAVPLHEAAHSGRHSGKAKEQSYGSMDAAGSAASPGAPQPAPVNVSAGKGKEDW